MSFYPYLVSGLRVVYDFSRAVGNRVKSVTLLCRECSVPQYHPLIPDQVYNIIVTDFIAGGGDGFMLRDERLNITKLGKIIDIFPSTICTIDTQ